MTLFLLTSGEYSDYSVSGLYRADREIPEAEYQAAQAEYARLRDEKSRSYAEADREFWRTHERNDWYKDKAMAAAWEAAIAPHETPDHEAWIIEKLGLKPVEYVELHEYDRGSL